MSTIATKYAIFQEQQDGDWKHVGTVQAPSSDAALREHLHVSAANDREAATGIFVSTPARSWKPRKVEAKQAFSFS